LLFNGAKNLRDTKTMAKPLPARELEAIVQTMQAFADGASLAQISDQLAPRPNRRSLQRWLAQLIGQGRLRKQGVRRGSLYFLGQIVRATVQVNAQAVLTIRPNIEFPLSEEAQSIAAPIAQPLQHRTPVGYNPHFLDSYRPNTTFYLPESTRADLLAAGQAANADAPAGTYARQIASRLLIDLSWNSSRLEGNTYSLLETERLLIAGEAAEGRNALEAQMILNHKEAIEFLIASAAEIGFNRYTLLNLHALLSDNLLDDPTASGRLRSIAVGIGHTVFHPLEGPQRIEETFQQILDTASAITDPFEQAFFVMVHIPYLQPFEDVNKRLSRLAANISLIKRNLCPSSFVDVSQTTYISAMLGIYELNRIELLRDVFVWAYKRSCARYSAVRQSLGEPDPFRIRYRVLVTETVSAVVHTRMSKASAIALIQQCAKEKIPEPDQARFIEVVETQLMSLHEGNIARYRLRPSEFEAWQTEWK
jgi:fido (protein-threonine AMPylation protein)